MNDTQLDFEFEAGDDKEYEVDGIWDSAVYAKESAGQLPGFTIWSRGKAILRRRILGSLL